MSEVFSKIVNMSISASWLILAVLLCRFLLRKAPKWVDVLLWGIVAVRAVCPLSIESALSLMPSAKTVNPAINTGISAINSAVDPVISRFFTPSPTASANPLQIWLPLLSVVWAVGVAGFLVYAAVSYWRLRRKLTTAVLFRDNIYESEHVTSPFVLGVIRPRIYLPFKMDGRDREHVIAHEQAHIRRRDHWWKPLGFLLLAVHWFNPLMWLSYVLLCRDIELACDEKVIRELNNEQRADYTQALLACSVSRRVIAACPLAFGEVGVKERVKSVMNYRKPTFWVIVVAVVACAVVAVCFLTNPKRIDPQLATFLDHEIEKHHRSPYSMENFCCWDKEILGITKSGNQTTVYLWVLYMEYGYGDYLEKRAAAHTPTAITVEGDGDYRLVEYWTPGDGYDYAPDIWENFPWYLYLAAIDSQRYIDKQSAACRKAAEEHFGIISNDETSAETAPTLSPDDVIGLSQFLDSEIAKHYRSPSSEDRFCCWDKEILETTQNGDQTTVYLWVLYEEYIYDDDLRQETGAHIPTVITVEGDGDYKLAEYWEPRDGYYAEDIRDKFPQHLHSAALDSQIYIDKQSAACWKAAQEHFGVISDDETSAETAPTLSLDDVITLSQKGYDLSWVDFKDFDHIDIGSGLYIWRFAIDEQFSLLIGGRSTRGKPMYIRLKITDGIEYTDIRDGGVAEFIELHK